MRFCIFTNLKERNTVNLDFNCNDPYWRFMLKDIDISLMSEIYEKYNDNPIIEKLDVEDRNEIESALSIFRIHLNIQKRKQKIIDSLDLLTPSQIASVDNLISLITFDGDFVTVIYQPLTNSRRLANNSSGIIDFVVPRRTITFEPNELRQSLKSLLIGSMNKRRKKKHD